MNQTIFRHFLRHLCRVRRFVAGVAFLLAIAPLCPGAEKNVGVRYDPEDGGVTTPGHLSVGKFYRYSRQPAAAFRDTLGTPWSDGHLLTEDRSVTIKPDAKTGEPKEPEELCPVDVRSCVGWLGADPVGIVIDLGRSQILERVLVTALTGPTGSAEGLEAVGFEVLEIATADSEKGRFDNWEGVDAVRRKGERATIQEVERTGSPRGCRFVRVKVRADSTSRGGVLLLHRVEAFGRIKNSWRNVPSNGCFHGAFPTAVGFSREELNGRKGMVVDVFERLVGKPLALVLWYQGMRPGREFAEISDLRARHLRENFSGCRFLSVGWLPDTLDSIIDGSWDEYFIRYFRDSVDPKLLHGIDGPIWFRPMNEFNGGWVKYGLKPDKFRKAWRRIYNIAEQTGAAAKHLFVWAPNCISFPNKPWNSMTRYYPGDQYVDWVGASVYPHSAKFEPTPDSFYPVKKIAEVYDRYSDRKPIMIAEGGYNPDVDHVRFVREWFEGLKAHRPRVRAVIWENHLTRVLSPDPKAVAEYQKQVADSYWLGETRSVDAKP